MTRPEKNQMSMNRPRAMPSQRWRIKSVRFTNVPDNVALMRGFDVGRGFAPHPTPFLCLAKEKGEKKGDPGHASVPTGRVPCASRKSGPSRNGASAAPPLSRAGNLPDFLRCSACHTGGEAAVRHGW